MRELALYAVNGHVGDYWGSWFIDWMPTALLPPAWFVDSIEFDVIYI